MDSTKLQAQGILEAGHGAYKTFSPTVATVAAVVLAMFCAFVEYEVPVHSAHQVAQVRAHRQYQHVPDLYKAGRLSLRLCSMLVLNTYVFDNSVLDTA